jgi:hypothetical protein
MGNGQDSMSKVVKDIHVDKLMNNLLDRAFRPPSLHTTDMDESTLGKPTATSTRLGVALQPSGPRLASGPLPLKGGFQGLRPFHWDMTREPL